MFTFNGSDRIDFTKMKEESFFLIFVVGLINQHLSMLPNDHKHENKFKASYQWGGCGHSFIDIYPIYNLQATICMGLAGVRLGYSIFLDCEKAELADNGFGEMRKNEVSLKEIDNFIRDFVKKWFGDDGISQYPQFVAPEG